ncbi:MAG: indole-3-glycerol phosphate synthase TrpC [Candidatus Firestonebacteria bacterium]
MKDILNKIIENKKKEVAKSKKSLCIKILKEKVYTLPPSKFKKSLSSHFSIIAEVKKASPSKGIMRKDFNPVQIAKIYEKGKADAISVLTDNKYFKGNLSYLKRIKNMVSVPILRKDFIIDEYQIYESRYYGADAVLLIVSILTENKLRYFIKLAKKINMDCLVEVHSQKEIKTALKCNADIIGINNRDLRTFKTDLKTTERLIRYMPDNKIVISESGIKTKEDIKYLKSLGVDGVLIGETFMRSKNITSTLKKFSIERKNI